jgi:hypothetical protein
LLCAVAVAGTALAASKAPTNTMEAVVVFMVSAS